MYYTFNIDIPYFKNAAIVVLAGTPTDARSDAYVALRTECGAIGRITTTTADAKRTRKLNASAEPIKRCVAYVDGKPVQWAWLVIRQR